GKENGVNILKSIDEGPFQMGTVRETLAEGTEGAPHLGPERPRVYSDLSLEEKDRVEVQLGMEEHNIELGMLIQNFDYFKDKMLLMQAQENRVALDEEKLLFLAGGQDKAIDEDVDEQPLKYQNLKDSFRNNPPTPAKDTPDFDSVFVIGKIQASLQGKDNVIKQLKKQISHLQETHSEVDRTFDFRALGSQITQLTKKVTVLQAQNKLFRAENGKIKQHYKESYDSIKITRVKHIEQVTTLTTENVNLKAQILNNVNSISKDYVKPTVLAPGKYVIDVEPIPSRLRNNREAHLDYLGHLKESVETILEIVEEAKVVRTLDRSIVSTCRYTKHSQELLEYATGTCLQDSH
nr:hypothetical protein [Tanacetum cinerariifolium]